MPHVLLVSPLPPPAGGVANWTRILNERGLPDGWRHSIVDTRVRSGPVFSRQRDRVSTSQARRWARILRDMRRELREGRPDVVHLNVDALGLGLVRELACAQLARNAGVPYVVHYRGHVASLARRPIQGVQRRVLRRLARMAANNLSLNQESTSFLKAELQGAAPVTQVPNFYDDREIRTVAARERAPAEPARAIFIGAVNQTKGAGTVLEAARLLPDVHFLLLGKHYPDTASMLLDAPDNVEAPGETPHDRVVEALARSHLFVFPTAHQEGFPNVVCEAMAAGVPVIARPKGAIAEMVQDGAGILLPDRSPESLVRAVRKLVDHEDQRHQMASVALEKARTEYAYPRVISRLTDIWEQAAALAR